MRNFSPLAFILGAILLFPGMSGAQTPLGSAFAYQGRLTDNGSPANGNYDLSFEMFSDAGGTTSLGTTCANNVSIVNGLFTVELDFGAGVYSGSKRWIKISVRPDTGAACNASLGTYTALTPIRELTPATQSRYAVTAGSAVTETQDLDAVLTQGNDAGGLQAVNFQRIGVAETVPAELLEVQGGNILIDRGGTQGFEHSLIIRGARASGPGGPYARIDFSNYDNDTASPFNYNGARILSTNATNNNSGDLQFWTNPDATGPSFTLERMRITPAGRVGIANTVPDAQLEVTGTFISGANTNVASGTNSAVVGGSSNTASGNESIVTGGNNNDAVGAQSTVGGGINNTAGNTTTTVGGGQDNDASGLLATIGGGLSNVATGARSTIGGGKDNDAQGNDNTIGGGQLNVTNSNNTVVAGGSTNQATGDTSAVLGGVSNVASNTYSMVGAGFSNDATGAGAAICGGQQNTASSILSFIGGGSGNTARGTGSVVVGGKGNQASGEDSMILGGANNIASGRGSVAMGRNALASHDGAVVIASSDSVFSSSREGELAIQALGGAMIATAPATEKSRAGAGIRLEPGAGAWTALCDRDSKENFKPVDSGRILELVASMPIATWNWKAQGAATTHIGPTAQDFHEAFGLGTDDKGIATVDADGVALAAIQGLNEKLAEKDKQINELNNRIQRLEALLLKRSAD